MSDRAERARWFYTPNPRRGVALNRLGPRQQQLALRLLASGLSDAGFTTANLTMSLENLLDRDEAWAGRRSRRGGRDPMRYAVAIFGDPGRETWGWRFEGHHLSVRYVVRGQSVSCTPMFIGAHPARSVLPGHVTLDVSLTPSVRAVELLSQLSEAQTAQAVISSVAPTDIVTSNRSVVAAGSSPRAPSEMMQGVLTPEWARWLSELREELGLRSEHDAALQLPVEPDGIEIDELSAGAAQHFQSLIEYYTGIATDEVAAGYRRKIASGGTLRFAWAGPIDGSGASYFRVRNERLLIEFSNAQNQANHVHAVWRDPIGDFGRELLGEAPFDVAPRPRTFKGRVLGRLGRLLD